MKREEYERLLERNQVLEEELKSLCNLIMKIKRHADRQVPRCWISAGYDPYKELTDEAQQGPLITELFEMVEQCRKQVRNK